MFMDQKMNTTNVFPVNSVKDKNYLLIKRNAVKSVFNQTNNIMINVWKNALRIQYMMTLKINAAMIVVKIS